MVAKASCKSGGSSGEAKEGSRALAGTRKKKDTMRRKLKSMPARSYSKIVAWLFPGTSRQYTRDQSDAVASSTQNMPAMMRWASGASCAKPPLRVAHAYKASGVLKAPSVAVRMAAWSSSGGDHCRR